MAITRPTNIQKPFAVSGTKNTIPVASQIGITNGAASFTDGFPPLTFTPIAAGGVPPSGADMNGILNIVSAHIMALNAGDLYYYDSTLATAIGGYDKGALLLRSDNTGYWFNTVAANSTNPDTGGAGWVPAYNYGLAAITGLTNANVTLTQDQYSKSVVTLAGTLTGNVNIIFPAFVQNWTVANNTTGAFTVTAKTASGTGVALVQGANTGIWGDGTNIYSINANSGISASNLQDQTGNYAAASGTNTLTATFSPALTTHLAGRPLRVLIANTNTGAVTFNPNGIGAKNVVNQSGVALEAGDLAAGGEYEFYYDGTNYQVRILATALTKGYVGAVVDDGTKSSGTYTPTPIGGNFRKCVNGGAFTLAAPTQSGDFTMIVQMTNNASAGAVTASGFTTSDLTALTTTNTNNFFLHIVKLNGFTTVRAEALQ